MEFKIWCRLWQKIEAWLTQEVEPADPVTSDFSQTARQLKPGDVILVEGRTRISRIIKFLTRSSWTHSAIYIGSKNNQQNPAISDIIAAHSTNSGHEPLLIEAELGLGTVINPLKKYQDFHIRVCRPKTLTHDDAQKVLLHALKRLGIEYDVRHLMDLARYFTPYCILPRRWRSIIFETGSKRGTTHTICSTLVAEAFHSVNYPVAPYVSKQHDGSYRFRQYNPRLCVPRDFDASPYFEIIKIPAIPLDETGAYRDLHWVTHDTSIGSDTPQGKKGKNRPWVLPIKQACQSVYAWLRGLTTERS